MSTFAFIAERIGQREIKIDGEVVVTIRAVTSAESMRLYKLYPYPEVRGKRPDPNVKEGEPIRFIPDEYAPEYRRQLTERSQRMTAAEVALGLTPTTKADLSDDKALDAAVDELLGTVPQRTIDKLHAEIDTLGVDLFGRGADPKS